MLKQILSSIKLNYFLGGLLIAALAVTAVLVYQNTVLRKQLAANNSPAQLEQESQKLVDSVAKLLILPKDEEPTIATVKDLDKLKGQQFFTRAQLGDKVLIYSKAKKVILYRPSANQIIEVAPLTGDNESLNK